MLGLRQNLPLKISKKLLRLSYLGFAHKSKRYELIHDTNNLNLIRRQPEMTKLKSQMYTQSKQFK